MMITKAQKENQARFKAVQAKAKELKAKSPKLTHIEAVKKAWALMPGKGIISKTIKVKKMPIAGKLNLTGKETRLGFVPKKVAAKKVAAKKPAVSKHKDTKSHNVNIKVVSGFSIDYYQEIQNKLLRLAHRINDLKELIKYNKSDYQIDYWKDDLKKSNLLYKELRTHAKEIKKLL